MEPGAEKETCKKCGCIVRADYTWRHQKTLKCQTIQYEKLTPEQKTDPKNIGPQLQKVECEVCNMQVVKCYMWRHKRNDKFCQRVNEYKNPLIIPDEFYDFCCGWC